MLEQLPEITQVEDWRLQQLIEAGYAVDDAAAIARADVDLHQAVELLASGCLPELAARILL